MAHAFTLKPISTWTMLDFNLFYANAESVAADGDLATVRPELREFALEIVAHKSESTAMEVSR
jgi:hypothetical protein